jgi:hypothetical protein
MALCYYITGHGFGHAVRTTQVIKSLPPDLPLILKTTAPERLFREELPGRDFTYVHAEYDCGCLQSDSVTVLRRETLTRYGEIARENAARLPDEITFLRDHGVRCVASDIPSFPLQAARAAGIPGVAVANFTWHDIYVEYVETDADAALLRQMAGEYAAATMACLTPLSVPTVGEVFPNSERVPIVARRGQPMRDTLVEALDVPRDKHLALLYLGNWGLDIHWPALEQWKDWVFLLDSPLPQPVANVFAFDAYRWGYAEVAASVDAVISKAGYGTITECIANSVPLIYLPRRGFIEHEALVLGMNAWGGGVEVSEAAFFAGEWKAALHSALAARPDPGVFPTNGADVIANKIVELCQ